MSEPQDIDKGWRPVHRTLYLDGKLIGLVDTPELAAEICAAMNAPRPVVHIRHEGVALCGKPGLPGEWAPPHEWVPLEHGAAATCSECIASPINRPGLNVR